MGNRGGKWSFVAEKALNSMVDSMAMTQEPIDWSYLPYIRPIFEA